MKSLRFSAFLFIGLSALFVSAEPILTQNTRVYSENNAYYANIAKSANNLTELSVFMVKTGDKMWSSWLDWGNDYSGYLSNDGAVFIAVNHVYSEYHNLITVYRQAKQESYTVASIPMNREYLRLVKGKYLWTDFDTNGSRFLYGSSGAVESFELERNDKRVVSIKLK